MYLLRQNKCVPEISGSRGDTSLKILDNISGEKCFRKKLSWKRKRHEKERKTRSSSII